MELIAHAFIFLVHGIVTILVVGMWVCLLAFTAYTIRDAYRNYKDSLVADAHLEDFFKENK